MCSLYGDLCDALSRSCWPNRNTVHFPQDVQRNEFLRTNQIIGMTPTFSRHYTMLNGNINQPTIYDTYAVTFAEQPRFDT